jgi:hypothetical protein
VGSRSTRQPEPERHASGGTRHFRPWAPRGSNPQPTDKDLGGLSESVDWGRFPPFTVLDEPTGVGSCRVEPNGDGCRMAAGRPGPNRNTPPGQRSAQAISRYRREPLPDRSARRCTPAQKDGTGQLRTHEVLSGSPPMPVRGGSRVAGAALLAPRMPASTKVTDRDLASWWECPCSEGPSPASEGTQTDLHRLT